MASTAELAPSELAPAELRSPGWAEYTALHSFAGQVGEVSITRGERLLVSSEEAPEGWILAARTSDPTVFGYVPLTYVQNVLVPAAECAAQTPEVAVDAEVVSAAVCSKAKTNPAVELQTALLSFEDDSDAAGERYDQASGARFNALHAHEELVRLLPLGLRAVAFMLHERCRMLARTGFSDLAQELWTAQGRDEVLGCGRLHLEPILRLEPAELLPGGETRSHWLDHAGERHALAVRWSATGHALRVVLVDAPPTSHREWAVHVETGDEAALRSLLAPSVVLRDATNERTACGLEEVLGVLLRWSRAARGRVHRVTRAEHPAEGYTRLHLLGYWPLPDALRAALREELGGEPLGEREAARPMSLLQLQQETLQWGRTSAADAAVVGGMGDGWKVQSTPQVQSLQVQNIWWRGLLLPPGSIPRRQPLPLDMYGVAEEA